MSAARGEGPAGLAKRWRDIAGPPECWKGATPTDTAILTAGRATMHQCADELETALEAAAPAGTPSPFPLTKEQIERITARVQPQIEHEFIHGYTSATAQVLRVLTSLKIELDALATPSPQAPAKEQK